VFDLELESEPSSAGGAPKAPEEVEEVAPSETVEEVEEIEEVTPEPEISEVEPIPEAPAPAAAPSAPAAAPSAPAPEKVCPNCGIAVAPNATSCAECGANLIPGKAPPKKIAGIANAFKSLLEHKAVKSLREHRAVKWLREHKAVKWLREHKAVKSLRERKALPLIAAVAAVIVLLIVTVAIVKGRKPKPRAPVQPIAKAKAQPAATEPQKPPPPAEPTFHWLGFSDPAAAARDQILKLGRELAAFTDKNRRPPATLADAGATEAESAELDYVGPEIAALPRFRAMAYDAKPSESYIPYVLFSDGSARPVPAPQIPADLLKKTESGWLTAAEAALLAETAPLIRVANVRFASLQVSLDDQTPTTVPRGTDKEEHWTDIPATAGVHQITLAAGEQKESFQAELKPGIVYTFIHPWQADLPWIPLRQYHAAITGQKSDFSVDKKDGYAIKSLKGPDESVDFLEGDGRTALSVDLHSLTARIIREKENLTIEGLPESNLIRINSIGRLESGVVKFKGDITVTFRKTALGTLRSEELPNTDLAGLSLSQAGQGKSSALEPGTAAARGRVRATRNGTRGSRAAPRTGNPEGRTSRVSSAQRQAETAGPPAETPPPPEQLAFPLATFALLPDCQAIAPALSSAAPAAIESLLQRAQLETSAAEAPAGAGRGTSPGRRMPVGGEMPAGREMQRGRRAMPAEEGQGEEGPRGRGGRGGRATEIIDRPLRAQEVPAPLVYGALALYGDPLTFHALSEQCDKLPAESPAYPALLLALARSGGASALPYLRAASEKAPTSAVIALCTIDDPATRSETAELIAGWTAADITEAVDEWPAVAGPTCRIAFVEALASANPALLDDMDVLNALMKFDPFTLERVLAARFEAALSPPAPTVEAKAAPKASETSEGRRRKGPGSGRRTQPNAKRSPQGAAPPLRPPAPLSWIALAHFKNSAAVAGFVALLDGNDQTKRLYAVEALSEVRDPSLVPILTTLLQDKQVAVRQTAAIGLIQTPEAAIVGAVDAAMDKDLLLCAIVEQAPAIAAKAGAEAAASLLAKMLTLAAKAQAAAPDTASSSSKRDPPAAAAPPENPDIARSTTILEALIRLGLYSPEVKAALEAARQSPDAVLRVAAYKACEQEFAGASAAERSASLIAAAGAALKDTQSTVRCAGIGLLASVEPAEALPLLLPALKDPEADVRAAALSALPQTADDPRIPAAITNALSDPSPLVVSAAARAAARRHDPTLGPALLAALNEAESKSAEKKSAEQAAGEAAGGRRGFRTTGKGRPAAPPPPASAAAKPASDRSAMLIALAEAAADLQPPDVVGALAKLLTSSQPEVRAAAARALGKVKDPAALNSLLSALDDADSSVVLAAVGALGESEASEAAQGMLDALGKDTLPPVVRGQILTHLADHCADPNSPYGSWAATGTALKDSDLDILVSMAPSATGDERAGLIALATRYLADSRTEARKRAAAILANYPDDEAVRTKLLSALELNADGVGQAAAEVLRSLRDDSTIDAPLLAYYKKLCESSAGGERPRTEQSAPPRPAAPAAGAAAPAQAVGPYAGLLKATPEESLQLRAAIIEALGAIGNDHAARALRTIADLEQKKSKDDMTPKLIAAFESAKTSISTRSLCDCYVVNPGPYRLDAIAALARLAPFDSDHVTGTLQSLARNATTPRDLAAAATDALDEIQSAGGA
jgi:HEAT repeat protein